MSDLIDQWQDDREQYLTAALANVSAAAAATPESSGRCLNCDEQLVPAVVTDSQGREIPRRWCDHDCMADWQLRQRAVSMAPVDGGSYAAASVARIGDGEARIQPLQD